MNSNCDHEISVDILDRFAEGRASDEERRRVFGHILTRCPSCLRHLHLAGWSKTEDNIVPLGPPSGSYDEAFAATERTINGAIERQHLAVRDLLVEVDAMVPEEREFKIRNLRRYAVAELAAALVDKSFELRYHDVSTTQHYARLAVAAAEAAGPAPLDEAASLADCRARAWAQLGNAYRISSELDQAERCFATSLRYLESGDGGPTPRAWVLFLLAALRTAQRAFTEAIALEDESASLYRRLHDRTGEASALVGGAWARIAACDPAPAIEPLQRAIDILHPWHAQEVTLVRVAAINLVLCYIDVGRPQDAYDYVSVCESYFEDCPDKIARLHWTWQKGKIDRERGDYFSAEERLGRVRKGLLDAKLPEQAGEVLLDLAVVYARERRQGDFLRAMADAAGIFHSLGARREFLAALAQLSKLAQANQTAEALLRQLVLQCRGGVERGES